MAVTSSDISQNKFIQLSGFKLDENDLYDARCGEIFVTVGRVLIFYCSFCDSKYGNFDYFLDHLSSEHYEEFGENSVRTATESIESETNEEIGKSEMEQIEEEYLLEFNENEDENLGPLDESLHEYNELQCAEKIKVEEQVSGIKAGNENTSNEGNDEHISLALIQTGEEFLDKVKNSEPLHRTSDGYRESSKKKHFKLQVNISRKHKSNHSVLTTKHRRKRIDLEESGEELKSTKERGFFKCEICNKTFKNRCNLNYHSVIHSSERKHKCDICGFAFKDRSNLIAHVRRRHTGQKHISCEFCSKKFFTRTETESHMRTHTGEKPYVCSYCGLAFQTSSKMTMHAKRHTESAPFKCSYCLKEFWNRKDMLDHMLVHTKEKPFACSICSARFPRRKSMLRHTKLHEK